MKRHIAKIRDSMKIAVLAMSILALRMAFAGGPAGFETVELAPGNHVHYGSFAERSAANMGDNANVGFIVGDDCVLAVDAGGSLAVGQALRQAIRQVTDKPVCYVILTHVHPDHFFGAAAFLQDKPQFVAHENYPRQLAARARPYLNALRRDLGDAADGSEIVKPTLLVKDRNELDLGGRKVTVQAWPLAHTDDDLTVYDDRTRTLWLSDLLFIGHTPVIDGSITGFLGVMERLRAVDAEHYVPGHGRSEAAWPAVMEAQQRYFEVILKETRAAIRAKKTIQQAVDEVGRSEEKNWAMFDVYHRRNVTTAYTELEWE